MREHSNTLSISKVAELAGIDRSVVSAAVLAGKLKGGQVTLDGRTLVYRIAVEDALAWAEEFHEARVEHLRAKLRSHNLRRIEMRRAFRKLESQEA